MTDQAVSFLRRLALAVQVFFRVLKDSAFAGRLLQLDSARTPTQAVPDEQTTRDDSRDLRPALQLLSVLQREGRLIDFLQQDITAFNDTDVGAAARVVHQGCRQALQRIVQITPVHQAAEGHSVTVEAGYDATSLLLSGNIAGSPPFHGTLRHRGWLAKGMSLPEVVGDADCTVIAPAEVEL